MKTKLTAEELFREHAGFVSTFLHRLGVHEAEVDDLVQDVFLVVHRKGGYEAGPATPRSWLGAIAMRIARSARRTQARRRANYEDIAAEAAEAREEGPAEAAELAESLARVQRALDGMDLEHRAVFLLYELEGESCSDIAASLGVPVGTVYSRLHTARRRFRQAYARQAGIPHATRLTPMAEGS